MTRYSGLMRVTSICSVLCCVSVSVTITAAKNEGQQPKEKPVVTVQAPQTQLPLPLNERYVHVPGKIITNIYRYIYRYRYIVYRCSVAFFRIHTCMRTGIHSIQLQHFEDSYSLRAMGGKTLPEKKNLRLG